MRSCNRCHRSSGVACTSCGFLRTNIHTCPIPVLVCTHVGCAYKVDEGCQHVDSGNSHPGYVTRGCSEDTHQSSPKQNVFNRGWDVLYACAESMKLQGPRNSSARPDTLDIIAGNAQILFAIDPFKATINTNILSRGRSAEQQPAKHAVPSTNSWLRNDLWFVLPG